MAKEPTDQSSSNGMGTILMIAAIVAIAGLLVWLSIASRPDPSAVIAVDDSSMDTGDAGPTAPSVAAADFGADINSFVGREINLTGVNVAQIVSTQIVWVEVPTAQGMTPYPVKLVPALAAGRGAPATQTIVDIEGMVLQKTDSVLSAWEALGAIPDAGTRTTLEFGRTFIEARQIRRSSGS